jgi:hypothetical protein
MPPGAENASFGAMFYINTIVLPRQARDNHRENSKQRRVVFLRALGEIVTKMGEGAGEAILTDAVARLAPICFPYNPHAPGAANQRRYHRSVVDTSAVTLGRIAVSLPQLSFTANCIIIDHSSAFEPRLVAPFLYAA